MNTLFKLVRKIIISALLIYSFNIFVVSLNVCIPINFITVLLVSIFDFPVLIYLILLTFSL